MQKIFYCFILMCLCFVSSAQKHAVIKLKDCEVVIYDVYEDPPTLFENEEGEMEEIIRVRIKNDTAIVPLKGIYGEEVQYKILKLQTTSFADSYIVEQQYIVDFAYEDDEHWRFEYEPYTYKSEWQKLSKLSKNKFRILKYTDNWEKLTPYKAKYLPLKVAKKYLVNVYKKANQANQLDSAYYSEQVFNIKSAKSLEDLMSYSLSYIHLRITLFKQGKKVGERFIVFEYWYGC
jgi:hypothetical protein